MENNQLESFYFKETIHGVEHDYRITQHDCHYGIEKDGILIGEIQCDETWKQISDEPLSAAIVELIGDKIEAHFC